MKRWILLFLLLFSIVALSFAQQNVSAPQKFALVIGNGAYTDLGRLNNPVNDANDMETSLRTLGFTVEKVLDGNIDQMESAIIRLKNRLSVSKNSYGFFFYAGHGVQSGGINYLIPVGARIPSENFLRERAVSVQSMLGELNDAGNELNIIVLDACRDNPFSWARSGSRGLTVVSNQPADSIIVYATSAGSTASDGTARNGLFTSQLLKHLNTPGVEVSELFRLTGADVSIASNRQQIPAVYNQFFGRAYLGSLPAAAPTPTAVQPAQTPSTATTPAPAATAQTVTVQPAPVVTAAQPAPAAATIPANMVRINGGTFTMGSPANEAGRNSNETQRQVTVSSFYMGKYEVTQKEYHEVMGENPSSFYNSPHLPVENVTWFDAIEYCNKLSQREGLTPAYTITDRTPASGYPITAATVTVNWYNNGYRLPTEAEWEYACRAGTTTAYNTGSTINNNTGWYNANSNRSTQPVGQKPANAWGLFDMHGNVWEWCWDWYGEYVSGEQTNPRGAVSGNYRVLRGGSWNYIAQGLRSAIRSHSNPGSRGNAVGFRVVRNGQ